MRIHPPCTLALLVSSVFCGGCLPDIAPPANSVIGMAPPELPSHISIPVTAKFDPTEMQNQAEASIRPYVYAGDAVDSDYYNLGSNFFLKYIVWRDVLLIQFQPNSLHVGTTAYYWAEILRNHWGQFGGEHIAGCGKDDADGPRIVDLGMTTNFAWTSDWRWQPHTSFDAPHFRNPCKLTALDIDATPIIGQQLSKLFGNLQQQIDDRISARTNFLPTVTEAWAFMNATQNLQDNVWFNAHPRALAFGPVVVDVQNGIIKSSVSLTAIPEVTVGAQPTHDNFPMPAPGTPSADQGIDVFCRVDIDFGTLSQVVGSKVGLPYRQEIAGTRNSATISGITFYPSGTDIVAAITLKDPKGTLYLKGTPTYAGNTLTLANVDYTLATKNILAKGFDWLLHDDIRNLIGRSVNTVLSQEFSDKQEIVTLKLQLAANRDINAHAKIETPHATVTPSGEPFVTNTSIILPFELRGDSQLIISP